MPAIPFVLKPARPFSPAPRAAALAEARQDLQRLGLLAGGDRTASDVWGVFSLATPTGAGRSGEVRPIPVIA